MCRVESLAFPLWMLLLAAAPGCAGSYYESWTSRNPAWVSTLPEAGTGLHETLAGLQEPSRFDHRLSVGGLEVLRVGDGGVRALSPEEVAARLDRAPGHEDLAIVLDLRCRSKIDTVVYTGQRGSWLLLEGGRLSAWDLHLFGARCVFWNDFRPALPGAAALEERVRAFQRDHLPPPPANPGEYYEKGLAYLRVGRLPAAEEMLARGDRGFSQRDGRGVRFDRPSHTVEPSTANDDARSRARLEEAIDSRKGGGALEGGGAHEGGGAQKGGGAGSW
jgi:hypothetical protein